MKTKTSRSARRSPLIAIGILFVTASTALACQVPVFRYALERWAADRYEIVILHQGPLSSDDEERLARLRSEDFSSPSAANFEVRSIPSNEIHDRLLQEVWNEQAGRKTPLMLVLYPKNAQEVPSRIALQTDFTDEAIQQLVDSPVREKVAKNILSGDSAVWIFVPSGHEDQDSEALATLTEQVALNQAQLELPPQEELEEDEFFNSANSIELRVGFSIVTLRRDDPKERILLEMLMSSESDLKSLDQPMAFPVLGRGRVLYALVGKGISEQTIGMASRFIIGPCSCQVKEQNPGFDLLMAMDWDSKTGTSAKTSFSPDTEPERILLTIPPGRSKK